MKYIVEFNDKDGVKNEYALKDINECHSIAKAFSNGQYSIWKEIDTVEHFISWEIINTVQVKVGSYVVDK